MCVTKPRSYSPYRLAGNILSILSSDVLGRVTTFALYALVARYLGAFTFGQLSLALTLFYTFQIFSEAGLQLLVTREVAKDRTKTGYYLANGFVVIVIASFSSVLALLLWVWMASYGTDTALGIGILSLALLPRSLATLCEAVFQAWERMHYIALINIPANCIKLVFAVLCLWSGYGFHALITVLLVTHVLTFCSALFCVLRFLPQWELAVTARSVVAVARGGLVFLGLEAAIVVGTSINVILLSLYASEIEVGVYNAAVQMLVPALLVLQSIGVALYPRLCKLFDSQAENQTFVYRRVGEIVFAIALPGTIGLWLLSGRILELFYGNEGFREAAEILSIMSLNLMFYAVSLVLGQILLVHSQERRTLGIVVKNCVASLILGGLLIPMYAIRGAAYALLVVGLLNAIQHYHAVKSYISFDVFGKFSAAPLLAVGGMAIIVRACEQYGVLVQIGCGVSVYVLMLAGIAAYACGGFERLQYRYSYLWLE